MKLIHCNGKLEISVIWVNRQKDNMQASQKNLEKNPKLSLRKQAIYLPNAICIHLQDHVIIRQTAWFKQQKRIKSFINLLNPENVISSSRNLNWLQKCLNKAKWCQELLNVMKLLSLGTNFFILLAGAKINLRTKRDSLLSINMFLSLLIVFINFYQIIVKMLIRMIFKTKTKDKCKKWK